MIATQQTSQPSLAARRPAHHEVRVEFFVSVPPGTSPHERIFISGNHERLGQWRPDGLELLPMRSAWDAPGTVPGTEAGGRGEYHGQVDLPRGTSIEYKITRGRWHTAEKSLHGDEIPNRRLRAECGALLLLTVESWDPPPQEPVPAIQPLRGRR